MDVHEKRCKGLMSPEGRRCYFDSIANSNYCAGHQANQRRFNAAAYKKPGIDNASKNQLGRKRIRRLGGEK